MTKGHIPTGQPGGHIGKFITYAYCTRCGVEWVWNASGIPNSMENCGHPDDEIITVNFEAQSHGTLEWA